MESLNIIFKIVVSALTVMVISYFAQEQADRYASTTATTARFFQNAFTVAIIASMVVLVFCIIYFIWMKPMD